MASSSRETPLYAVWCPEIGQDESMASEYGALDVKSAAEIHARYNRQWERWPKEIHVKDPDGVVWCVLIRLPPKGVIQDHAHMARQ